MSRNGRNKRKDTDGISDEEMKEILKARKKMKSRKIVGLDDSIKCA